MRNRDEISLPDWPEHWKRSAQKARKAKKDGKVAHKLRQLAYELGDIPKACKQAGITPDQFYEITKLGKTRRGKGTE
jgi:hypothetical protein